MSQGLTLDLMRRAWDVMGREPTEAELECDRRWLLKVEACIFGHITLRELFELDGDE